jgi:hypothetical protein
MWDLTNLVVIYVCVQQLATLVSWCMLEHLTTWFNSFVLNSPKESILWLQWVFHWCNVVFVKKNGW